MEAQQSDSYGQSRPGEFGGELKCSRWETPASRDAFFQECTDL
jgi:hypothetical protein